MDKEIDLKMAIQEAYLYFGQEPEISIERHIDLLRRIFKDNGAEPVIRGHLSQKSNILTKDSPYQAGVNMGMVPQ